ncbi:MAG: hypothetical protein VX644_16245, partial [Planctomycetota bacterium]|nr:hypothetical protein [Planctomycetota bacterium]
MNDPVTHHQQPSNPSRILLVTGLLLVALIAIYGHILHHAFFHDDAYITLRYSQNWLDGNGVNWNADERVEGYTSFLHLALVSFLGLFRIDPVIATRIVGLACYGAICWLAFTHFRKSDNRGLSCPQFLLLLLVPTSFSLISWSYGGLETSLVTLLVMLASYAFVTTDDTSPQRMLILGVLFSLACLARPDVGLLVAISLGFLIGRRTSGRSRWTASGLFVIGFAILYAPYFCWRYSYYGELLPNTFYAKMTGFDWFRLRTGLHYVHTFARIAPYLLPLTLVTSIFLYYRGKWSWKTAYMLSLVGGHTFYIIYTGGDHMPAYRFFVPIIPLMGWIIASAGNECLSVQRVPAWSTTGLLILLVMAQVFSTNERMRNAQRLDPAAAVGADVGHWLADHLPAGSVVALNTAGSTPYHARQLVFIDMLGLNDRQIAHRHNVPIRTHWQRYPGHAKGDGQYVLTRRPDLIILGPAEGVTADPTHLDQEGVVWFLSDQELAESNNFRRRYRHQRVVFQGRSGVQRSLTYYRHQP